jgi:WhiB family redox-sensing transcriptional regulator
MPALHRSMPRAARPEVSAPRTPFWRDGAACFNDDDPDAWFAEPREKARVRHALATCYGCPVRTQCLDFAMARTDQFGIWGGLTEQDRKRLLAAASRPAVVPVPVVAALAPAPAVAAAATPAAAGPLDPSPMDLARQLGGLRSQHGSITATARAAGMSRTRVTFLLDLLNLDEGTQARVHAGNLKPEVAVGAVRSQLRAKRAS